LPARGATGDGRDVDDVSASVGCGCPELVEEHLGSGDRAEQVDLDHPAVVVAPVGGERAEQHDAGVVDEHRRTAELGLHTVCRREQTVAVGDVGLDGDDSVAELVGESCDPVGASGQRDTVAGCGKQRSITCAGLLPCASAMPPMTGSCSVLPLLPSR
jgi:hypothetical protein